MESLDADPFLVVENDVASQLAAIGDARTRHRAAPHATARANLHNLLDEIDVDLHDMQEAVTIAQRDPDKFEIDQKEIDRRLAFLRNARAQTDETRDELGEHAHDDHERSRRGAARAAACAAPSNAAGTSSTRGGYDPEVPPPATGSSRVNEGVIQMELAKQRAAEAEQEQELSMLSGVMDRLGRMGRAINAELRAQTGMIDELDSEVDATSGRLGSALTTMRGMLKGSERGKLCAIFVLSLVLIVLMVLVFQ